MRARKAMWMAGMGGALLLSLLASLMLGSVDLPLSTVGRVLWGKMTGHVAEGDAVAQAIVWNLRVPRALLALLVGAALGAAGAAYQGVLRNPLADPYILGVSSGAALGAVLVLLTGWPQAHLGLFAVPLAAFGGGMAALLVTLRLGAIGGRLGRETTLLAGVVVQAFLGAALTMALAFSADRLPNVIYWLMGSLANRDPMLVAAALPYVLVPFVLLLLWARDLNVFTLGEEQAAHLGVETERRKTHILLAASLMTAAAVSVSGIIGFVGLVVPHVTRLLVGPDHRVLVPMSALAGAFVLLWADTFARTVLAGAELPVGAVTAILGAPFFAYLLRRSRRGW